MISNGVFLFQAILARTDSSISVERLLEQVCRQGSFVCYRGPDRRVVITGKNAEYGCRKFLVEKNSANQIWTFFHDLQPDPFGGDSPPKAILAFWFTAANKF